MVVRYRLCPTATDNLLRWDGAVLIVSLMTGYDTDFAAIIKYELHKQNFGELTTLPFPCLVLLLCDEAGVPDVSDIDQRVEAIGMSQTSLIKDFANSILVQKTIGLGQ